MRKSDENGYEPVEIEEKPTVYNNRFDTYKIDEKPTNRRFEQQYKIEETAAFKPDDKPPLY